MYRILLCKKKEMISLSNKEKKEKAVSSNKGAEIKKKELPKIINFSLTMLASLFTFVSAVGRLGLILFDLLIPQELRELAPLLQMYRKYTISASEILAGKKSSEIIEVSQELDELALKEHRKMKSYPIRRGVGEGITIIVSTLGLIVIPEALTGKRLDQLLGLHPAIVVIFFGTALLIVSWIAAIFGPIHALFYRCSRNMMKLGAYRWASFFQDLENLFALPYHAAKSTFSFFDAPPISAETYSDFKDEIINDFDSIKEKVQGLLALDAKHVPDRTKEMLEKLLRDTQIPLHQIDLTTIHQSRARTFALLIWKNEGSLLPWKHDEAVELFAEKNDIDIKEARQSLNLIVDKVAEEYLSHDLYSSLMITGALKGIAKQEEKYKQIMSDIEYNKLAIALALGAQQYLKDRFKDTPKKMIILKMFRNFFVGVFMPVYVLIRSIFLFLKHFLTSLISLTAKASLVGIVKFHRERYKEIKETLSDSYFSVRKKGRKMNLKKDLDVDVGKFFKIIGKFLLRILIFVPSGLWTIAEWIYQIFKRIIKGLPEEKALKKKFDKELATESLAAMYQEIYEKMLLSDLTLS